MAQPSNTFHNLSSSALSSQSILDVFVLQNILDSDDAERLRSRFRTNRETETFLVRNKIVTRDTINKAYSIMLKLPYVELKGVEISSLLIDLIPEKIVRKYGVVPFSLEDGLIRIALSRPSDLLASYESGLEQVFRAKKLEVELFVTGESDFNEVIKQYRGRNNKQILVKKGSLPVVFLRNQFVPEAYYKRLPKEFVEKYRMIVFGQNRKGSFLLACEQPDSPLTIRIIDFLQRENHIKVEQFATSKDDIEAILELWGRKPQAKQEEEPSSGRPVIEKKEKAEEVKEKESGQSITNIIESWLKNEEPEIVIDDVRQDKKVEAVENKKNENEAEEIVSDKETTPVIEKEEIAKKIEDGKTAAAEPKEEDSDTPSDISSDSIDEMGNSLDDKNIGNLIEEDVTDKKQLVTIAEEGFVPKIVAAIINFALLRRSSDIHIEPEAKTLRIRCRIDGILEDVLKIAPKFQAPVVSRIKILSKLKIDESRIPQDGRFEVNFKTHSVDVRVSTLPTVHGEKVVMRILDKSQTILSLEDLGMQGSAFKYTIESIKKPYGIILSTGPTGSGKTTTLYAVLNRVSSPSVNIVTLEDPVEYDIPGINQCQIKPEIGFTFAAGLRSILRQDPNIIMVGEIRDAETAGMATHAALTGHLVLSTLHTNDTAGALPRLINMGVEPFLITSSINLVIAQRLVRRICPKCKEEMKVPQKLMDSLVAEMNLIPKENTVDRDRIPKELRLWYGKGCNECNHGFKGRVGIFEVMTIDEAIEDLAISKRPANEIKEAAIKNGMITMRQDGIIKAFSGSTTIDEVFQAVVNS